MHDMFGSPIKIGDEVLIPATVTNTSSNDEYCNVSVETKVSMFPSNAKTSVVLNTKQVIRNNKTDDVTRISSIY